MVWRLPSRTAAPGMLGGAAEKLTADAAEYPPINNPASALFEVKRLSPAETPRRGEEMILPRIALLLASGCKISANV